MTPGVPSRASRSGEREPLVHPFSRESLPREGEALTPASRRGDYRIEDRGYDTPCWIWQKTINRAGYGTGSFRGAGIVTNHAHRAYYLAANGAIPAGWHVHHKCEVHPCVNPTHLEAKPHVKHLADHKREDSHLSWDDVREIRRIACEGDTPIYELGERYGLGKSQVFNIVANLKWHDPAYVPGRPAVCVLEECAADFLARRSNQRFCCTAHRRLWNSRRTNRRSRGVPLDGPSKWWKGDLRDAA